MSVTRGTRDESDQFVDRTDVKGSGSDVQTAVQVPGHAAPSFITYSVD